MTDHIADASKMVLDLDKLEALTDAATPGEWRAWITRRRQPEIYTDGGSGEQNDKIACGVLRKTDAAFIAAFNPKTAKSLIASAREAAAEIEGLRARFTELADDFEKRADACHALTTPGWEERDLMRLRGKEAAYRHAMMLSRAAQMDGEG